MLPGCLSAGVARTRQQAVPEPVSMESGLITQFVAILLENGYKMVIFPLGEQN